MSELLDRIKAVVGDAGILSGSQLDGRSAGVWKGGQLEALALVRPRTTQEVSEVMAICHDAKQAVVPVGGMTGLAEGHETEAHEIALSMERMTAIESIDSIGRTMTVEAGAILQNVQDKAAEEGLLFALDLGARASCTIGGNIATNAGGNRVIRYGMMRDLVLGVEAVLADGTVISSMNAFIKNNTGYDIRQLFAGSEGTLGVITRAVLRLHEAPITTGTTLLALKDWDAVMQLLRRSDQALGGGLVAYEVMWHNHYALNTGPHAVSSSPLETSADYYVIMEAFGADPTIDGERLENLLVSTIEDELVLDGVIAKSEQERRQIWDIRESFEAEMKVYGGSVSYDVSLPLRDMETYTAEVQRAVKAKWPEGEVLAYGHVGDGNLHFSVVNVGDDPHPAVDHCVYEPLRALKGSVSAEHGIGLEKKHFLEISRSPAELNLMRTIKKGMDPENIMNPGKVIEVEPKLA